MANQLLYAVVCDDGKTKKPYQYDFTHYVFCDDPTGFRLTDCNPTLFSSILAAETALSFLKEEIKRGGMPLSLLTNAEFAIKPIRLVHSRGYEDSRGNLIEDARSIISGMTHYDTVAHMEKKLAGKILTLLDATLVSEKQNKAVKDLTKQIFRAHLSDLFHKTHEDIGCGSAEDNDRDFDRILD